MLDDLDSIPWGELLHAYGSAGDVPDLLRNLACSDSETRKRTYWTLYGNIFHQGTRYQATSYAVPFLYELIEAPKVEDKHELLLLLTHLAVGYPEGFFPAGIDAEGMRAEAERALRESSPEDLARAKRFGFGPDVVVRTYDEVLRGLPRALPTAMHRDPEVRACLAYLVAWFPEAAEATSSALERLLRDDVPYVRANAILAVGVLRHRLAVLCADRLRDCLHADSSLERGAAAIALAKDSLDDDVVVGLIEAFASADDEESRSICFGDGNLATCAGAALESHGPEVLGRLQPALEAAIRDADPAAGTALTRSLLSLTFPRGYDGESSLDTRQRSAAKCIADCSHWKFEGMEFVNFSSLVADFGLPASAAALQELAQRI
jgi:hypothetical protein